MQKYFYNFQSNFSFKISPIRSKFCRRVHFRRFYFNLKVCRVAIKCLVSVSKYSKMIQRKVAFTSNLVTLVILANYMREVKALLISAPHILTACSVFIVQFHPMWGDVWCCCQINPNSCIAPKWLLIMKLRPLTRVVQWCHIRQNTNFSNKLWYLVKLSLLRRFCQDYKLRGRLWHWEQKSGSTQLSLRWLF